jgi:hypothetical protein
MAVSGEREVEGFGLGRAKLRQVTHEIDDSSPQEGLAARQANLGDPERDQNPRHAQVIGKRQLAIDCPFVAGSAVDTLVIAAVGYRNPQVSDAAAEFVSENQLLAPGFSCGS